MDAPIDSNEHFIEVPTIATMRRFASQAVGISVAELETPFADSLIAEGDSTHS
jgi:hypothetical protein